VSENEMSGLHDTVRVLRDDALCAATDLRNADCYSGLCVGAAMAIEAAHAHLPSAHPAMMAMLDVLLAFRPSTARAVIEARHKRDVV
jgi:hypothetical protein